MPRRFQPNRRLLKLLVGSNLYGSPDACIRELVQNAWDAISLRKTAGDGGGGAIDVRYSIREGWFETVDDGIGMDMLTIENSFLQIGQDKLDALHVGTRQTQIGYFGIGILSVFLVADRFEVVTRHQNATDGGLRFEVTGLDDEVTPYPDATAQTGTRIRVYPRPTGTFSIGSLPEYVENYARHVRGISVLSEDDHSTIPMSPRWLTDKLSHHREIDGIPGVIAGRFGINPALRRPEGTLSSTVTICNAGFLAESEAQDMLPRPELGMIGEIDMVPNALTMGMSRERLQRDDQWRQVGALLQERFVIFAVDELESGELRRTGVLDMEEIRRNLLLWYHYLPPGPEFASLLTVIENRVYETVPFTVADGKPTALGRLVGAGGAARRLFYRDVGRRAERTEQIDDDGLPIRFSQEIRDSIRVGALRAKGFDVIELGLIRVNVRVGNSVQAHQIQEAHLVQKCLSGRGLELVNIVNATETDMDLRSIERLPVLNDALSVGDGLRFASVPDSTRRIITDSAGVKYINLRNNDVKRILRVIPAAVSNPLKKRLLDAYLKIENFQFYDARQILMQLLESEHLESLAMVEAAPFTEKHVRMLIEQLLRELDG